MERRADLRRLLEAHRPFDPLEARHLERMAELLDTAVDPFDRRHFDPGHFTASGFVLSPDGGALLRILHSTLCRWLQPGGHVDPHDADVLAAARREVAEEVSLDRLPLQRGFDGLFDVDVHRIPADGHSPAHEHFDLRFLFRAPTLRAVHGSDARDARWWGLEELAGANPEPAMARVLSKLR